MTTWRLDQNILCHREMVQMRMDSFRNTTHRRTHGREKETVTKKWLRNSSVASFVSVVCFFLILVFTFSAFALALCIPFTLVLLLVKVIVSIMYK